MKEKLISRLENDEGYLPDEARRTVESAWWLIKLAFEEYSKTDISL